MSGKLLGATLQIGGDYLCNAANGCTGMIPFDSATFGIVIGIMLLGILGRALRIEDGGGDAR